MYNKFHTEVPALPLAASRPRMDVVSQSPLLPSFRPWLSDICGGGGSEANDDDEDDTNGDVGSGGTLDSTCKQSELISFVDGKAEGMYSPIHPLVRYVLIRLFAKSCDSRACMGSR